MTGRRLSEGDKREAYLARLLALKTTDDRSMTLPALQNRLEHIASVNTNMMARVEEHIDHVSLSLGIDLRNTSEYRELMRRFGAFSRLSTDLAERLDPWYGQPSHQQKPWYQSLLDRASVLACSLAPYSPIR